MKPFVEASKDSQPLTGPWGCSHREIHNLFIYLYASGALEAQAQSQSNPDTQRGLAWVQHILQASWRRHRAEFLHGSSANTSGQVILWWGLSWACGGHSEAPW